MGVCRFDFPLKQPASVRIGNARHAKPLSARLQARNRSSIPLETVGIGNKLASQDKQLKREYLVDRFNGNAEDYDEASHSLFH